MRLQMVFILLATTVLLDQTQAQTTADPIEELARRVHNDELEWSATTFGAMVRPTGNTRRLIMEATQDDIPALAELLLES